MEDHTDMTDYSDEPAEEHTPEEADPSWHATPDDQATIEEDGYGYGV